MCEEEFRELGLALDVLYHLEARVLIAVPVLTTSTTLTRGTHDRLHTLCYLLWPPRYQHSEGFTEKTCQQRVEGRR